MPTTKIQARRNTASSWATDNPVLSAGEPGHETDSHRIKYGDGSTAYASLPYVGESVRLIDVDSGVRITENVNTLGGTASNQHKFTLAPRNNTALTYAVPYFRSTTTTTPTAVDSMPNGTGLSANNGNSWFDACDTDCAGSPFSADLGAGVNTARLAATTDHVSVGGYASTGAASAKPFWIRTPTGTNGATTPQIKISQALGGVAAADGYTLTQDNSIIYNASGGSNIMSSGFQLATNTQYGFLYIPQIGAAPTGTPHAYGKSNALCYVQGAKTLKIYDSSLTAWVTFTGV